ncbi:MAG: 1-acyl-sn-glycerol-3-phosphate acyltransferase [Candidatus Nanopelagicales bacterium]|jgi:1-acyl-sn-glycerol-3-phosphate acyltransferase|nr:1-acyl-sn-glycerol-3-phosphate acyltransferase [Candidatus Nanopelagicales bacterium]
MGSQRQRARSAPVGAGAQGAAVTYDALLDEGRTLYPGVRIGRPGRSRGYWAMITALRLLRVRYHVHLQGARHVAPGPAILVGNHVHLLDPVMVVMSTWWRVSAFTKVEAFEGRGAAFFRIMGQIPLRRGDPASTAWAMAMSRQALAHGGMLGIYPEGTRSPDPGALHRLHKRVLIPVLQANPEVPVHAVTTAYRRRGRWRRVEVSVRVSEPLALPVGTADAQEVADRMRDALLALGGQRYVDRYARDVKRELRAVRAGAGARHQHG